MTVQDLEQQAGARLTEAALGHPFTVLVLMLAIALGSFMAVGGAVFETAGLPYPEGLPKGMDVDIFQTRGFLPGCSRT